MRIPERLRSRKVYATVLVVAVAVIAVWLGSRKESNGPEAQLPSESPAAQSAYSETANPREGASHLAARALDAYLAKNGVTLDAVQHLWAVSRLSDSAPAEIKPGQSVQFLVSSIEQALAAAKALTAGQRATLLRYIR